MHFWEYFVHTMPCGQIFWICCYNVQFLSSWDNKYTGFLNLLFFIAYTINNCYKHKDSFIQLNSFQHFYRYSHCHAFKQSH